MRFKHSVHNAAGGLISIAAQNRFFSTALAAGQRSVEAGLLEADVLLRTGECDEVVVAFAEDRLPMPLDRFSGHEGLAVAFCLKGGAVGVPQLSRPVRSRNDKPLVSQPDDRFSSNPIAWALPLLAAIEEGSGSVRLSGGRRPWTIEVEPAHPSENA